MKFNLGNLVNKFFSFLFPYQKFWCGNLFKKAKPKQEEINFPMWMDKEGVHALFPGIDPPDTETLTKECQKQIKNSPLFAEMVKQFGKEKAEELLKEFKVKLQPKEF